MIARWLGAGLLVILMSGSVLAEKPTIELEGRYWMPSLSASGSAVKDGVGTELDFVEEVGIEDKDFPEARLTWYVGNNGKIRIAYMNWEFTGSDVLERDIVFNGETYSIGHEVFAKLDLKYLRVGWFWQFMASSDDVLKFGPVIEGKIFWADAMIRDDAALLAESATVTAGLPTVGFALDFCPVDAVCIYGEITGVYAGTYGHFFDAELGGKYTFELGKVNVGLETGWRTFIVKVDYEDDYFDMDLSGAFVGVVLSF